MGYISIIMTKLNNLMDTSVDPITGQFSYGSILRSVSDRTSGLRSYIKQSAKGTFKAIKNKPWIYYPIIAFAAHIGLAVFLSVTSIVSMKVLLFLRLA